MKRAKASTAVARRRKASVEQHSWARDDLWTLRKCARVEQVPLCISIDKSCFRKGCAIVSFVRCMRELP